MLLIFLKLFLLLNENVTNAVVDVETLANRLVRFMSFQKLFAYYFRHHLFRLHRGNFEPSERTAG